ncbi:hypothetical protein ACLOJK_012165 [Asimina triloba]
MDSASLPSAIVSSGFSRFVINPSSFKPSPPPPLLSKTTLLNLLKSPPNHNPNLLSFSHNSRLRSLPRSSSATEAPSSSFSSSDVSGIASSKLSHLVSEFKSLPEPLDRVKRLLDYAALLPPFPDADRLPSNRVMGCTAQVWLSASMDAAGRMRFAADSDSEITKGFCSCLIWVLDGAEPEEVLGLRTEDLGELNVVGLPGRAHSRVNTWHNVLISMRKRTKSLVAEREGKVPVEPFPSLLITEDSIHAKGPYAEAQVSNYLSLVPICQSCRALSLSLSTFSPPIAAKYLFPDEFKVKELVNLLTQRKIGIVAHFYMDPEVQGVLTAAQKLWPHIHISDSLVMADRAVKMAEAGCQYIAVLGVDFMSENVRAILDQAGFTKVTFL